MKFLTLMSLLVTTVAYAGPQKIAYEGKLLDPGGNPVVGPVSFMVQIRSPGAEDCLLFEENHNSIALTNGYFSLNIGGGSRAGGSFHNTSTMAQVFAPTGTINSLTCVSGTSYTAVSTDSRKLRISFYDGATWQTMTTDLSINSAPFAMVADSLQGKGPSSFLQPNTTGAQLSQSNLEQVFASPAYVTELIALAAGNSSVYAKANGGTFSGPIKVTASALPGAPSAGHIAVDSSDSNKLKWYDGSSWQTVGASGSNVTSVGAGTGIAIGGTVAAPVVNLTTTAVVPGSYGGSSIVPSFTVDAEGRLTAAAGNAVNDTTKLPLAGGTMTGSIDMGAFAISNVGHIVQSNQGTLFLGKFTNAEEATMLGVLNATTDRGRTWYNVDTGKMRLWDGSAAVNVNGSGGGGDALTTNPLSQFAATTSSQLAGLLTDEQGTGAAVFANSPTINSANLITPTFSNSFYIAGATAGGVGFGVPATSSGSYVWPAAVPASNQVLQSDSAGNMSWVTPFSGTDITGTDVINALSFTPQPSLGYTPVNRAGDTMTGVLTLAADPSANMEAATKQFVVAAVSGAGGSYVTKDGLTPLTGNWDLNGATAGGTASINGLANPTVADGVANKAYVDSRETAAVAAANSYANGKVVSKSLAVPSAAQDGQSIRWNNVSGTWEYFTAATGAGTVTSIATGTGLTGGPITNSGTISLAAGGVSSTELATDAVTTAKILNSNVTYAKIQNVTTGKILGRSTVGSGPMEEITIGSGLSLTGGTLSTSGIAGTVTNVSSANSDIIVATGTSTPVLTLNAGIGANQIVRLSGTAELPGVSGANLSNLNASNISSGTIADARLSSNVALKSYVDTADLKLISKNLAQPTAGDNGKVIIWNNTSGNFEYGIMNSGDFRSDGSIAMSGQLVGGSSSETFPAFTFSGDQTTGLYKPISGTVGITAGGLKKATFDSGRNSFFGESEFSLEDSSVYSSTGGSPLPPLAKTFLSNTAAVDQSGSAVSFKVKNGAFADQHAYVGAISTGSGNSPSIVIGQQTSPSGYNERLRISPVGLVGIGTAAPAARLHVDTLGNTTPGLIVRGVAAQSANLIEAKSNTDAMLFSVNPQGAIVQPSSITAFSTGTLVHSNKGVLTLTSGGVTIGCVSPGVAGQRLTILNSAGTMTLVNAQTCAGDHQIVFNDTTIVVRSIELVNDGAKWYALGR